MLVSNPHCRHLPNLLTLFRLLLIIPFILQLEHQHYPNAFYIFVVAGFTDGLDGFLARQFHWQSTLGSVIDPLADKLLVAVSAISLALLGVLPWWLVILMFLRDVTISLGVMAWYYLVQRQLDFMPTQLSKINTCLQLALLTTALFQLAFFAFPVWVLHLLITVTALTTTVTYFHYVCFWGYKAYSINDSAR